MHIGIILELSEELQRLLMMVSDPQICDLTGLVCGLYSGKETWKILSVLVFNYKYNYKLYSINFKRFVL